jgi:HSP20 family protein
MQREMDRLVGLGKGIVGETQRVGGSYPPVNVYNGPSDIIVQCEIAGVAKGDMDLNLTGETLVVKGVKRAPQNDDKLRYQQRERGFGEFNRTIVLPDPVEADKVEAKVESGILTVRLPKSEAARPRTIPVK